MPNQLCEGNYFLLVGRFDINFIVFDFLCVEIAEKFAVP